MKKVLVLILTVLLLSTTVTGFADMGAKLEGHWSKDLLSREFVAYYFPYLAKQNFERLSPNETISNRDFTLSLGSLTKDYDLDYYSEYIVSNKKLRRRDVVTIVGSTLEEIEDLRKGNDVIPFLDIEGMDDNEVKYLDLLYNLKIINGVAEDEFAPNNIITQAEAMVILQRVKGVLDKMGEIPFEVKGRAQAYNSREGVYVKEDGDKVLVNITKMFGTPGYDLDIEKIVYESDNNYQVYLDITSPEPGAILAQVVTYKTITVEVNKSDLKGEGPYNFIVQGINGNLLQ